MRLCAARAGASSTHVCPAQYLQPPPYVPCRSARHLLCPSLAFPTSFCHLCLRKVSCALPQHAMSPSLPLASMCAVYNIPSRTHTEPAPQCRTWPSTLAGYTTVRGCVQLVQVLQAFMSAPHLATPTNFFLHLAFSGPSSSPHAYATRAGPTLDWPLSSYKPGSPRALTCSPLRACQSCLPGAQRLIRVAPISHLL